MSDIIVTQQKPEELEPVPFLERQLFSKTCTKCQATFMAEFPEIEMCFDCTATPVKIIEPLMTWYAVKLTKCIHCEDLMHYIAFDDKKEYVCEKCHELKHKLKTGKYDAGEVLPGKHIWITYHHFLYLCREHSQPGSGSVIHTKQIHKYPMLKCIKERFRLKRFPGRPTLTFPLPFDDRVFLSIMQFEPKVQPCGCKVYYMATDLQRVEPK